MKRLTQDRRGFTVIELLVFIVVLVALAVVGVSNVRTLKAQNRDSQNKTNINAVYYQLESFYEKNGYYPETVNVNTLKGIDPNSLKDTNGLTINQTGSLYLYKPTGCEQSRCKSFELRSELEKEAPYSKQSLNKG